MKVGTRVSLKRDVETFMSGHRWLTGSFGTVTWSSGSRSGQMVKVEMDNDPVTPESLRQFMKYHRDDKCLIAKTSILTTIPTPLVDKAKKLLKKYDKLPLECDGFTRVATYVLGNAGVPHKVCVGTVTPKSDPHKAVQPHFWVEIVEAGAVWVVDYRLRMWLGEYVPHGVFRRDVSGMDYVGTPTRMRVSPVVFEVLTAKNCVPGMPG